jgi:hypothetical protein
VLEVEPATHLLAQPVADASPRAVADRLVPRLQVVQAVAEQQRQRRRDDEVVVAADEALLDPLPLVVVDHAPAALLEHAAGA